VGPRQPWETRSLDVNSSTLTTRRLQSGGKVQDPRTTIANLREWQGFTALPSLRVETGNAYHLVAWEQMLGPLGSAVRSFEQSFFHEPMCWFVEGRGILPPRRTSHWEQSGRLDLNLACQSLFIATWMGQCNALQPAIPFFSSAVAFRLLPRPGHRPSQYSIQSSPPPSGVADQRHPS
jgi:hypothetical protein